MKKFSIILLAVLIALIALAKTATCQAQTFTVPLPQVTGNYPAPPGYYDKYFSFDLGTTLSQVNSVTFVCSGTITCPQSSNFFMSFTGHPSLMAGTTFAGAATYPNPEPFSSQTAFSSGANWNFLLDGKAAGYVALNLFFSPPEDPLPSQPIGTIDSASLVIDAVVPEPATLLLLGLGGMMVRKRS